MNIFTHLRNQSASQQLSDMREFKFRLHSTHQGTDNAVATLHVEHYSNNKWQIFDLNVQSRGFLIFVYSCFICQHTYLRMNITELDLPLLFIHGTFSLTTTADWQVVSIVADFEADLLTQEEPNRKTVDYLIARMKECPVSRNLTHHVEKHTTLTLSPNNIHDVQGTNDPRHLNHTSTLTNSALLSLNSSSL